MVKISKIFHNIGILAHVDAGKTTLTEQLLFLTGAIRNAGSVDAGTTATDNLSIEKKRGISVRTATATTQWQGVTINIIDTPGHMDFAGEVERALLALDYAIVIVSAVEGVRAHTENILKALDKAGLPRIIFVNKIDRAGADPDKVMEELKSISTQAHFLLSAIKSQGNENCSVECLDETSFCMRATEILADLSEEAADLLLTDKLLTKDRAEAIMRQKIADCTLIPVVCGSAKQAKGIDMLANALIRYMPDAIRRATDDLCGIIFKIEHDKTLGKISHIRLFGGQIATRDEITLIPPAKQSVITNDAIEGEKRHSANEKVSQIKKFCGAKGNDISVLQSGDVAAVCGLPSAKNGFFIGRAKNNETVSLVHPFLRVKVTPKDNNLLKLPSLAAALSELSEEEPYMDAKWENGQKEITISTTGRIQLEVLSNLLKERYALEADFSPPTVIYKETPSKAATGIGIYTMPKPCWAIVEFYMEPMPRGYGVSYHGKLPNDQCFYRYQSHIRTSFDRCLEQGLHGWEVTDFKCTLVGGEHHTIHTHPLDFFVCTPMAFMNTLVETGSTVLEPLLQVRIVAPEELSGRIFSEIIKMDGEYDNPIIRKGILTMEAILPVATSMHFPERLAILSSGKAVLSQSFYGYRECRDGLEHKSPRRGINPLDRSKWILWARGAYQGE